jgi:murein DD-endopeptidase MepM/ murein hydrolase activator NlpD
VTARLTPVPAANADVIPPFNPIRLYGASEGSPEAEGEASATENKHVAVQVVELLGGILPGEDGQAIDEGEALSIAERALEAEAPVADLKPTLQREGGAGPSLTPQNLRAGRATDAPREPVAPNTTILAKTTTDDSDLDDAPERNEVRVVRAGRGDTLVKILQRLGADLWTARAMVDAGKSVFPESQLGSGHEVHVTLVPSLQKPDTREPARFSVFSDGHLHKLTVSRNAAGEFVASAQMPASSLALAALGDSDQAQTSSLYGALYNAALSQAVPPEKIMQVLRTHAYETDFRRRVGLTDALELFFDVRDEPGSEPTPGELLFTALTVGGETQRYWRFRSSDGVVDYYDEFGNNSRKFLMRRPIRGEEVRFTSGYGIRFHPLLNERRMHTGVDWSAPIGTPILAAGNGVVEEADRKGQYGNYIRIRHANGYQTSYAHMSRFAPGIQEGVKVRQGQVIGFVGNTGLSSGPHLHYEVLVSNRYVDPMQIQVPRERRLTGRQAAEFQRERSRIDELMRRPPVMTITR